MNGFAIEIRDLKNHQTFYEQSVGAELIPRTTHQKQIIMYILRPKLTGSTKGAKWRNRFG
jgi:catechol-2,3-dioxygenase